MSQYWGAPDYPPPQRPQYQLPQPEGDYYQPSEDPRRKQIIFFVAGSCITLLLICCCVFVLAAGWVIDERFGITATQQPQPYSNVPPGFAPVVPQPQQQPVQPLSVTPQSGVPLEQPGSQPVPITPAPEEPLAPEPFVIGQSIVVPELATELIVLDIQRNVQPNNLAPADGMEFVAVSVQLSSLQATDFAKIYELNNFRLQNSLEVAYLPDAQADNGRRLENGQLPQQGAIEGDLLFHIPMGEAPLFLVWQATGSSIPYTIILQ